jgi:predicted transposase/invertase (TIGR01784 family)
MSEDKVSSPHDAIFKTLFENQALATELFQAVLPAGISECLNWKAIQREHASFIDFELKNSHADLLYRVPTLDKKEVFLYCLCEHQSVADAMMPLRFLTYMCRIWEHHRKEHPNTRKIPAIFPILFHHERQPFEGSVDFLDLIDLPNHLKILLKPYMPVFAHQLLDLPALKFEALAMDSPLYCTIGILKVSRELNGEPAVIQFAKIFSNAMKLLPADLVTCSTSRIL